MARLLTCGFENGSLAADGNVTPFFDAGLGGTSFSYSTTTVRSGQRSLHLQGGGVQDIGNHVAALTSPLTVAHVAGFPTTISATNKITGSVTPAAVGDLLVAYVTVDNPANACTGLSGVATSWTLAASFTDTPTNSSVTIWYGVAASTGAGTVTATFTTAPTASHVEWTFDSFRSSLTTATWGVSAVTNKVTGTSTTIAWPSLTPTWNPSVYVGYAATAGSTSAGSTPGVSYFTTDFGFRTATDATLTVGTALAPTAPSASGSIAYASAGVVLSAAPTYYARLAFNIATFDAGEYYPILLTDGSTGLQLAITPAGVIQMERWSNHASVGTFGPTIVTGRWYVLECSYVPNTGAFALRLNGLSIGSGTVETATDVYAYTMNVGSSGSIFIDDWAVNDSTGSAQNSWCDVGQVVQLMPTADSSRVGFTTGAGGTTNLWDAVNNSPPVGVAQSSATATSQIMDNANNATDNYVATMQSYTAAGVPAGSTVTYVQPVAAIGESAGGDNFGLAASNPTISEAVSADSAGTAGTFPAGWQTITAGPAYSPTVTLGTAPTVTLRRATANTIYFMACLMGLVVEYGPPPPILGAKPGLFDPDLVPGAWF